MKRFATLFVALGLAAGGSTVLADQAKHQVSKQGAKPQPVQMTDKQLDNVAAGQLIVVEDVLTFNRTDIAVAVPVQAANNLQVPVAVAILGGAGSGALQRPGRLVNNLPINQ